MMHGNTDGILRWYVYENGIARSALTEILSAGWHHVVDTANAYKVVIYVDGNLVDTNVGISTSIHNNANSVIHFGKDSRFATNRFLNGIIADLIYFVRIV